MNFDIASLTARALFWDTFGVWLAGGVLLGVSLEAVTTFDKLADWLRLNTLERHGGLRHKISKAGFLILVASLALEVIAAINSHAVSQQIIAGLNGEIVQTQNREQNLIDQSNDLAKTVRYLTTDRTISVQQVADKLRGFGRVPFVLALTDDRDTTQLCGQIATALVLAGWDWKANKRLDNGFEEEKNFPGKPFMRVQAARGITVNVAMADGTKLGVAARALAAALTSEELKNVEEEDLTDSQMKDGQKIYGVIHITVGARQ